jgi:hypothetical protein
MTRLSRIVVAAALMAAGCGDDPARAVKIGDRAQTTAPPPASVPPPSARDAKAAVDSEPPRPTDSIIRRPQNQLTPRGSAPAAWRPPGCPPAPQSATGEAVVSLTGPCAFEHREPVSCEATPDDFLVTMSRRGAGGTALMIFINVEKYAGPGKYDGGQMFFGIQDKTNVFRWSSDDVTATVGPGEATLILPATRLEAEPLLVKCSGPMTNYQCDGREDASAIDGTVEIVGGTFMCEKKGREPASR